MTENNAIIAPISEQWQFLYIMQLKSRNLKIVKSFSNTPKASLRLSGLWLEKAGFTIGKEVEVIVRRECLVIIPEKAQK